MAKHLETGRQGEDYAAAFLSRNNYKILFRNWKYKRLEVDFIAEKDGVLVFVEVKTRRSLEYGCPSEAVNHSKRSTLARAASAFLAYYKNYSEIRFDIVAVNWEKEPQMPEISLITDAFWPD